MGKSNITNELRAVADRLITQATPDELQHRLLNVFVVSYLKQMAIVRDDNLVLPCDYGEFTRYKHNDALRIGYDPLVAFQKLVDELESNSFVESPSQTGQLTGLIDTGLSEHMYDRLVRAANVRDGVKIAKIEDFYEEAEQKRFQAQVRQNNLNTQKYAERFKSSPMAHMQAISKRLSKQKKLFLTPTHTPSECLTNYRERLGLKMGPNTRAGTINGLFEQCASVHAGFNTTKTHRKIDSAIKTARAKFAQMKKNCERLQEDLDEQDIEQAQALSKLKKPDDPPQMVSL